MKHALIKHAIMQMQANKLNPTALYMQSKLSFDYSVLCTRKITNITTFKMVA